MFMFCQHIFIKKLKKIDFLSTKVYSIGKGGDKLEIGERIKKRREELKMSQQELAEKIGYTSRSTINKIEDGTNNLRQTKIAQIAKALNTTPGYLMGWEDQLEQVDTDQLVDFMLSEEDREMYSQYCTLSPSDKQLIRNMISSLASKGEG